MTDASDTFNCEEFFQELKAKNKFKEIYIVIIYFINKFYIHYLFYNDAKILDFLSSNFNGTGQS